MRKISDSRPSHSRARFFVAPPPERLVLTGYRCWQAGYETGDIACWEVAWNEFARIMGPHHAKTALGELSAWVRSLRSAACRALQHYPHSCRYVTSDEIKAVCMIGACQAGRCPLARAMAFELLGTSDIDGVLNASAEFATALAGAGQVLQWTEAPARGGTQAPVAETVH